MSGMQREKRSTCLEVQVRLLCVDRREKKEGREGKIARTWRSRRLRIFRLTFFSFSRLSFGTLFTWHRSCSLAFETRLYYRQGTLSCNFIATFFHGTWRFYIFPFFPLFFLLLSFFVFSFFRFLVFSFFLSRGNGFINSAVKYFLVEWNVNAIRESNIALSFISFYFRYFFSLFFLVIFSGKRIRGWKISRKSYRSIISSILSIISSRRVQSERCYELFLI